MKIKESQMYFKSLLINIRSVSVTTLHDRNIDLPLRVMDA